MGHGLLHQSNTPGRIGALLARSKDSHGRGEKVGVAETNAPRDVQRVQVNLLYLEFRRGTQVAQGRGLQNLHSWVRIPPAPPSFSNTYAWFHTRNLRPANNPANKTRRIASLASSSHATRHRVCGLRVCLLRQVYVVLHGRFSARVA